MTQQAGIPPEPRAPHYEPFKWHLGATKRDEDSHDEEQGRRWHEYLLRKQAWLDALSPTQRAEYEARRDTERREQEALDAVEKARVATERRLAARLATAQRPVTAATYLALRD